MPEEREFSSPARFCAENDRLTLLAWRGLAAAFSAGAARSDGNHPVDKKTLQIIELKRILVAKACQLLRNAL
jgi:hypothetical protein